MRDETAIEPVLLALLVGVFGFGNGFLATFLLGLGLGTVGLFVVVGKRQ